MHLLSRIKIVLAGLAGLFIIATPAAVAALPAPSVLVASDAKSAICDGLAATGGGANCAAPKGSSTIPDIIKLALTLLSFAAGVAAVIMIVVAGIRYITSGGDASGVKGAKDAIIYAVVGLIVVALSQGIVRLVLSGVK